MEYFSLLQIILLVFVGVTNIIIIWWAISLDDTGAGEFEAKDLYYAFCIWCVYAVISFGVYAYLGHTSGYQGW